MTTETTYYIDGTNGKFLSELDLAIIEEAFFCLKSYWKCEKSKKHLDYIFSKTIKLNELAKTHNAINKLETGAGKKFSSFKKMV